MKLHLAGYKYYCPYDIHGIPDEEKLEHGDPAQGAREKRFANPTSQSLHIDG